jgi:hypothetical protein
MRPSCRRASANLHVPVEQTTLLYKEGPELNRQPWTEQPAISPKLFHLGLGASTRNLPAREHGSLDEPDGPGRGKRSPAISGRTASPSWSNAYWTA